MDLSNIFDQLNKSESNELTAPEVVEPTITADPIPDGYRTEGGKLVFRLTVDGEQLTASREKSKIPLKEESVFFVDGIKVIVVLFKDEARVLYRKFSASGKWIIPFGDPQYFTLDQHLMDEINLSINEDMSGETTIEWSPNGGNEVTVTVFHDATNGKIAAESEGLQFTWEELHGNSHIRGIEADTRKDGNFLFVTFIWGQKPVGEFKIRVSNLDKTETTFNDFWSM